MPSHQGSAAVAIQVTPESAESYRQQLAAARKAACRSAARLLAVSASPRVQLDELVRAADAVLDDAAHLRGLAALVRRIA
jgi:hypothetical protein